MRLFRHLSAIAFVMAVPALTLSAATDTDMTKNIDIDSSKILYWVGEGEQQLFVMVRFNGTNNAIDNLVLGYRYNGERPSAGEVMNAVVAADARFTIAEDGALTFDVNGDGTITGVDASAADTADARWTVLPATCVDIDGYVLSYLPADTEAEAYAEPAYKMYLPAPDAVGVWVPEAMTVAMTDADVYVPALMQTGGQKVTNANSWQIHNAQGSNDRTVISATRNNAEAFGAILAYTGKTGEAYLKYRPYIGGKATVSNPCVVTVTAPEVPVTSIAFAEPVVESPLKHKVENAYTFEPADATYTAMTWKVEDTSVATASNGTVTTTAKAGETNVSVAYAFDAGVKADFLLVSSLMNPVTGIALEGVEGDVITLNPKQMLGIVPVIEPADADIRDVTVTLVDNGTAKDNYIATMYTVNIWTDKNNFSGSRVRMNELSGHREGTCRLIVRATDGSGFEKEFTVNVVNRDNSTPIDYTEGTIILNEEWFGHTNGGLNYLSPDYEWTYQAYERENHGMSFGCTSQHGTIFDGKLIVASKQPADGGDPLPGGGEVVVADAATLRNLGAIEGIYFDIADKQGNVKPTRVDGRAVVGAAPGKAYVSTNAGIAIIDTDNMEVLGRIGDVDGSTDLYAGQIGDMVRAGRYVFGIQQSNGVFVIDTDNDAVVTRINDAGVQGITTIADGSVWYATVADGKGVFRCIDHTTFEVTEEVTLPESVGQVLCSWGAWRPTQFSGSRTLNALFFCPGGVGVMDTGKGDYYMYTIGSDPEELTPFFSLKGRAGHYKGYTQKSYGQLRYDDRTGRCLIGSTEDGASGHYRNNWLYVVDPLTGTVDKELELEPYYWFQSLPLFPDKYAPEIEVFDASPLTCETVPEEPFTVDLDDMLAVTDRDNIEAHIRYSIADIEEAEPVAEFALNGHTLTVTPVKAGKTSLTFTAESNGRTVSTVLPVVLGKQTGVDDIAAGNGTLSVAGRRLMADGLEGVTVTVCDTAGKALGSYLIDSDTFAAELGFSAGVYVLRADNGIILKVALR